MLSLTDLNRSIESRFQRLLLLECHWCPEAGLDSAIQWSSSGPVKDNIVASNESRFQRGSVDYSWGVAPSCG